ncbi:MAG: beta-ketoacyl synthase chain length factor [bacterium]|nr:beta-ketoacyl synthase chain length factor [bacterium]
MEAFINGATCISHHNTVDETFFFEGCSPFAPSPFLKVAPFEHKNYIPSAMSRRASHILKMGITAGMMTLERAGIKSPDAIVVGTGMGCFEDTDKFLRALVDNEEQLLTPTSFIQSTHNSVAGQIALLTKCQGHNFTYVHQNNSFESALLDALMLLKEGEAQQVLVGGIDELNAPLQELFERAGHIKAAEDLKELLWESTSKGSVAGEGAAFFNLSKKRNANSLAKIRGVKTIQKTNSGEELLEMALEFLSELAIKKSEIDLVLSGRSGDVEKDLKLKEFESRLNIPLAYFKPLCGEYFTSGAFALWLGTSIIKKQLVPGCIPSDQTKPNSLRNILIVNHHSDELYSLICVSAC